MVMNRQLPLGEKRDLRGVVDLPSLTQLEWKTRDASGNLSDGANFDISLLSKSREPDIFADAIRHRRQLVETVADLDEELGEEFLCADDPITIGPASLKAALRRVVANRKGLPVFVGSALKNTGVQPLMDGIVDYLPSPNEVSRPFLRFHGGYGSVCALVFKILFDPNKGPLSFVRVYSGELRAGMSVFNVNRQVSEKIVSLFTAFADEMSPTPVVSAGNIAVISGFLSTKSGDTVVKSAFHAKEIEERVMKGRKLGKGAYRVSTEVAGSKSPEVEVDATAAVTEEGSASGSVSDSSLERLSPALPSIEIPEPVFFCSIEPPSMGKQKDLDRALERLEKEDPSLRVKTDEETNQTILSGMGELHLEIILDRIRREFKIDAELGAMQVVYKERVNFTPDPVVQSYIFDRVMNGKSCLAQVTLSLNAEKGGDDDEKSPFKLRTHEFWASKDRPDLPPHVLEKLVTHVGQGVEAGLGSGPLLGSPVSNARVSLIHASSGKGTPPTAISAAASHCVRQCLEEADITLLEPVMRIDLCVEPLYLESVKNDLIKRRGIVVKTSTQSKMRSIVALVPLAEMLGYSTAVRIITSGTVVFSATLAEYRPVAAEQTENLRARR